MSYQSRGDLLRLKRSTLPVYRDVRDRPVWEKLDTFYYNLIIDPNLIDILSYTVTADFDLLYVVFARLYRLTGENEYTWDGSTINIRGFTFGTNQANGNYPRFEDIRISTSENTAQITCQAQTDETVFNGFITDTSRVIFAADTATGGWQGATNCIVDYDNVSGWRTVNVYRALN
jgi:hypothetical protein